jgi:hypothetical protein
MMKKKNVVLLTQIAERYVKGRQKTLPHIELHYGSREKGKVEGSLNRIIGKERF